MCVSLGDRVVREEGGGGPFNCRTSLYSPPYKVPGTQKYFCVVNNTRVHSIHSIHSLKYEYEKLKPLSIGLHRHTRHDSESI